jgi:hypothetical protein
MLFTRTHTYFFPLPQQTLKERLVGKHVQIHNLDFEILEDEQDISIIPHAEQVEDIKTLPITSVQFNEQGNKTKVVVTSKMRRLDSGGPILILTFCGFLLLASIIFMTVNKEPLLAYILLGIAVAILTLFSIRLQLGYFDYVRKVHDYVKNKASGVTTGSDMPLMHA